MYILSFLCCGSDISRFEPTERKGEGSEGFRTNTTLLPATPPPPPPGFWYTCLPSKNLDHDTKTVYVIPREISTPQQPYCKLLFTYNTFLQTQHNEVGGQYDVSYDRMGLATRRGRGGKSEVEKREGGWNGRGRGKRKEGERE